LACIFLRPEHAKERKSAANACDRCCNAGSLEEITSALVHRYFSSGATTGSGGTTWQFQQLG
jgi:hypothetical protein